MGTLNVRFELPARDGNTCYLRDGGSSELHEALRNIISDFAFHLELSFEETLLTASDDYDRPRLLIEGRELSSWLDEMEKNYREKFKTQIKPAIESGRFNSLIHDNFLKNVIEYVSHQTFDTDRETIKDE